MSRQTVASTFRVEETSTFVGNVVANGTGTNEQVTLQVTGTPTGGSFILFIAAVPVTIAWNSTTAATATAINAALGAGSVSVAGGTFPGATQTLTFGAGYAGIDVPTVVLAVNGLTGGTAPSVTITTPVPGAGSISATSIAAGAVSASRGVFSSVQSQSLTVAAVGSSIFTRTADAGSTAITITASSHATSERAAITYGDWLVGQDYLGNGTKDFFIWNGSPRLLIGTGGLIKVGNSAESMRFVGDNSFLAFYEGTEVTRRGYVQGITAGMNVVADSGNLDLYGNGQLVRINSGYMILNSQMRIGSWPSNSAYTGLVDRASGGANNYIIMANTADTLISAPASGGTVGIRSGNNDANTAISVNSTDGARINRTQSSGYTWGLQTLVLIANSNAGGADQSGLAFWVPGAAIAPIIRVYGSFGERFDFVNNSNTGYVPLHASAFNVTSSIRIKEAVEAVEDAGLLDSLAQLQTKRYRMKVRPQSQRLSERFVSVAERWAASGRTPLTPRSTHYESRDHNCSIDSCGGTAESPCVIAANDTFVFGLIAEELYDVLPEMVTLDENLAPASYDVSQAAALAVGGTAALARQVRALIARIEALESSAT